MPRSSGIKINNSFIQYFSKIKINAKQLRMNKYQNFKGRQDEMNANEHRPSPGHARPESLSGGQSLGLERAPERPASQACALRKHSKGRASASSRPAHSILGVVLSTITPPHLKAKKVRGHPSLPCGVLSESPYCIDRHVCSSSRPGRLSSPRHLLPAHLLRPARSSLGPA